MGEWEDERLGISPGARRKLEEKKLKKELSRSAENPGPGITVIEPSATSSPCFGKEGH